MKTFFCFSYIIQYLFLKKVVNSRVWGLRFSQRCCWRFKLCYLVNVIRRFEGSECLHLQGYAAQEESYRRTPQCLEPLNLEDRSTTIFRSVGEYPATKFHILEDLDYGFSRTMSLSEGIRITSIWLCCIFLSFTAILVSAVGRTFL